VEVDHLMINLTLVSIPLHLLSFSNIFSLDLMRQRSDLTVGVGRDWEGCVWRRLQLPTRRRGLLARSRHAIHV
jgi:hypothetical protein